MRRIQWLLLFKAMHAMPMLPQLGKRAVLWAPAELGRSHMEHVRQFAAFLSQHCNSVAQVDVSGHNWLFFQEQAQESPLLDLLRAVEGFPLTSLTLGCYGGGELQGEALQLPQLRRLHCCPTIRLSGSLAYLSELRELSVSTNALNALDAAALPTSLRHLTLRGSIASTHVLGGLPQQLRLLSLKSAWGGGALDSIPALKSFSSLELEQARYINDADEYAASPDDILKLQAGLQSLRCLKKLSFSCFYVPGSLQLAQLPALEVCAKAL